MNPEDEKINDDKPKYKYDPYTGEYLGGDEKEEKAVEPTPTEKNENYFDETPKQSDNYFDETPNQSYNYFGEQNIRSDYNQNNAFPSGNAYNNPNDSGKGAGQSKTFGIISMILGIVSVISLCGCGVSIILGIVAVVFAALQMKRGKNGFAIAGLVMGIVGIVLGVFSVFLTVILQNSPLFDDDFWEEFGEEFYDFVKLIF